MFKRLKSFEFEHLKILRSTVWGVSGKVLSLFQTVKAWPNSDFLDSSAEILDLQAVRQAAPDQQRTDGVPRTRQQGTRVLLRLRFFPHSETNQ